MKYLFRPILTLLLICGMGSHALAQDPIVLNESTIMGYTIPHAHDLVVDDQGSTFVICSAYEDGAHLDVLIIKLGPLGDELWSRYINGGGHDYATGLVLDSAGDLWVAGWTDSEAFPTVEPMDGSLTGFRDIFLMKVDSQTGETLYSTFIGGDYADTCEGIAINSNDEIYLTGATGSTDFPTTEDALQPGPSFPQYFYEDAYVMRLAVGGREIIYSSYLGGTADDGGNAIGLDAENNIIIAGRTTADDFPLVDALDTAPNDMFLLKLAADGSTLLFSSYFGGEDSDRVMGMATDPAGNIYLTGSTRSIYFPTTAGSFQENFVGAINGCSVPFGGDYNCEDFFVSKVSTTGQGLLWSTYLGGTAVDESRAIAVDPAGNAYVSGYTYSADFPQEDTPFAADIVVCKLSDHGGTLDFTHTVPSGSANRGNGITLDADGDIYFSGTLGVPAGIYVGHLQQTNLQSPVGDGPSRRKGLSLSANYPNPFNPSTTIAYSVPEGAASGAVSLSIFDVGGRLVKQLVNERQAPGHHSVIWNGRDRSGALVGAGVYYYRLQQGDEALTRSMVILK